MAPFVKWIPIFGEFTFQNNMVRFNGGSRPDPSNPSGAPIPLAGAALSNQTYGEGTIFAEITFQSAAPSSLCGLILYRNPSDGSLIQVQLGGSVSLCAVWSLPAGGTGWKTLGQVVGTPSALEAGRKYALEVNTTGSNVSLTLDGAHVLAVRLPEPLARGEAGLFCQGTAPIVIESFRVEGGGSFRAFVVMQFEEPYNALYEEVIAPACRAEGVEPIRADEVYGPGLIIQDIEREILESQMVIADISPTNPNVYYEVGYAHAIKKPTILIADKATKLPFDVSGFRTLFYENSIGGKAKVDTGLRRHLREILKNSQLP